MQWSIKSWRGRKTRQKDPKWTIGTCFAQYGLGKKHTMLAKMIVVVKNLLATLQSEKAEQNLCAVISTAEETCECMPLASHLTTLDADEVLRESCADAIADIIRFTTNTPKAHKRPKKDKRTQKHSKHKLPDQQNTTQNGKKPTKDEETTPTRTCQNKEYKYG